MTVPRDQVRADLTTLLTRNKSLTERAVKIAIAKKHHGKWINARVIRTVRKSLGIDRPRAVAWARRLLEKNPRLEAKRIIAEIGQRFGIHLSPPDVTRLRPAGTRRKRAPKATPSVAPVRSRHAGAVTITYHAKGDPDAVALFFRTLAS